MHFLEDTYRLLNKYHQKAKTAKTYGTEELLYAAEVHMIEIIGSFDKITTTKLAQVLGITKGAVSQTASKLVNKGLIVKDTSPEKGNEIWITLSESGEKVFAYHRNMHAAMLEEIDQVLKKLPPESIAAVDQIIQIIDRSLDRM